MRFAIWSLELAIHDFAFFSVTLFLVEEQVIQKSILLAYFRVSGKRNFYIRDRARDPLCATLSLHCQAGGGGGGSMEV